MTSTTLQAIITQWWREDGRLLSETVAYEPWVPREQSFDGLAATIQWYASHTAVNCIVQDVDPEGLTWECVRAVLAMWWPAHGQTLAATVHEVWSPTQDRLFADLAARLLSAAAHPVEWRQHTPRPLHPMSVWRIGLWNSAEVSCPPMLGAVFGYRGQRRRVLFCATPMQQLRCTDGGHSPTTLGSWRAWQAFHRHPYVDHRLGAFRYQFGFRDDEPIVHGLVLSRGTPHMLMAADIVEAERFVKNDNNIDAFIPRDDSVQTLSENERVELLTWWLDQRTPRGA